MNRLTLALKLFFGVLRDKGLAKRLRPVVAEGKAVEAPVATTTATVVKPSVSTPAPVASTRSDALTLLAVLQREARLVDFLKEDIGPYADAQVGAAVRDVHRDAGAALERMFGLRPVAEGAEGAEVTLPANADAGRWRLVGNVSGAASRGRLQHAGWQATKVEVPVYSGTGEAVRVVAPAEVEV